MTETFKDIRFWLDFYERHGINIIPLEAKEKRPPVSAFYPDGREIRMNWLAYQSRMSTPEERERWFIDGNHNVGVVCGAISNLVVFDFDNAAAYEAATEHELLRPEATMTVATGRGFHVYLRRINPGPTHTMLLGDNPEPHHVKADGSYVVASPSIHPSGGMYLPVLTDGDFPLPLEISDEEMADIVQTLQRVGFHEPRRPEAMSFSDWRGFLSEKHPQGKRNEALARAVGIIRNGIVDWRIGLELALAWNDSRLDPPLPEREVETVVKSVYRYAPGERCEACQRPYRSVDD